MLSSRTPWLTSANRVLDFVGHAGMVIYCVLLFLVLLRRHRWLAFFTTAANLALLVLTQLLKCAVARPRPENRLVEVDQWSHSECGHDVQPHLSWRPLGLRHHCGGTTGDGPNAAGLGSLQG